MLQLLEVQAENGSSNAKGLRDALRSRELGFDLSPAFFGSETVLCGPRSPDKNLITAL